MKIGAKCALLSAASMIGGAVAACAQTAVPDEGGLAEIVVTAQRRTESLQDVPISITSITEDLLENMGALRGDSIFNGTSGISFTSNGSLGSPIVMVRGIGSVMTLQGVEPAVTLYVDDVAIGTTQAFNTSLLDIERVEVLRGPQGTLYGKNSMGGAIRFFSRRPENEDSLELRSAYGSHDLYDLRAIGNVVLADRAMLRASVIAQGHDPFAPNTAGRDAQNQNTRAFQVQTRLLLSESTDLNLAFDWSRDRQLSYTRAPFATATERTIAEDDPAQERRRLWGMSATLDHDMDAARLTSITAYRKLHYQMEGDSDHSAGEFATDFSSTDYQQFSQEVRLVSADGGPFKWALGAYYFHDKSRVENNVALLDFGPFYGLPYGYTEISRATLKSDTVAAFADLTYTFADVFDITGGVRYTHDRKSVDYTHASNNDFVCGIFAPCREVNDKTSDNMLTPRLVFTARWTEDLMTYASVSRGMKGAGLNIIFVPASLNDLAFRKETAWSYEAGVKSQLFDRRLRLNASVFHFDWADQQVEVTSTSGSKYRTNAPSANSTGGEIELTAKPVDWIELAASYAYTKARFGTFSPTSPAVALSGNRQPHVPHHNAIASITIDQPISEDMSLVIFASHNYKSGRFLDPENVAYEGGTSIVDGRIGIETNGWSLSLFANNLFNKTYRVSASYDYFGSLLASVNDPRTYGIRARLSF